MARAKGSGYMAKPEEIEQLKAEISDLMAQGYKKTHAVWAVAARLYCSRDTIWTRLREG